MEGLDEGSWENLGEGQEGREAAQGRSAQRERNRILFHRAESIYKIIKMEAEEAERQMIPSTDAVCRYKKDHSF